MGLLLTILLGAFAGYIASVLLKRDGEQNWLINIVVGILGAFLANVLLSPIIGIPATLSTVSLGGFIMSVIGAVVLLIVVNLFTRGRVR